MKKYLLLLLFLLNFQFISQPVSGQSSRGDVEFIRLFNTLQQDLPRERIYLHTDRDWYFSGDRIWFSSYIAVGSGNILTELSKVVYVELYDPEMNRLERIAIENTDGRGRGSIPLDVDLDPGVYKLKAYTAWSKNFGESYASTKEIEVHNAESEYSQSETPADFHIDFMPEGGHMISGLENRVGFKALNSDGLGIDIQGSLYNSSDTQVLDFSTEYAGMGDFRFTPENGMSYYAMVEGKRFNLPDVVSGAVQFSVTENDYDQYVLNLRSNDQNLNSEYLVFGHVRGNVYMATEISITDGRGFTAVPKSTFATGVVHFTVLSNGGEPISERLVFNQNPIDDLDVDLSMPDEELNMRNRVNVGLNLQPGDDEDVSTSFASITVFDDELDSYNSNKSTIKTKFLLESDIPGHIENPGYYFSDSDSSSYHADLLMLTQGWSAYDMSEVKDVDEISLFSLPEDGIKVSGNVRSNFLGRDVENATVVFSLGTEHEDLQIVTTDLNGRFTIPGLDITGTEPITLRANNEDGGDNVRIGLSEPFAYLPDDTTEIAQSSYTPLKLLSEEQGSDRESMNIDSLSSRVESAQIRTEGFANVQMEGELDEIEVTAERETEDQSERDLRIRRSGSQRVDLDESPELTSLPIEILLNQIPGVSVNQATNSIQLSTGATSFGGTPSPLILLDDIEITADYLFNIPPSDIQTINVFRRGTELALYGSRGTGGVISVRSRTGSLSTQPTSGYETAFIEGYQPPTRFYSPRYGFNVPQDLPEKDTRITLHWEPNHEITDTSSEISFWTNDIPSTYRIEVQGITEFGTPFYQTTTFETDNE
jgi:hypothetical protein